MPLFFLFAGWLFSMPCANANSNAIFQKEGNKATVLLMGLPGDSDSVGFFQALKVAPEDFQGKLAKRFSFTAEDDSKALDVACVFSKTIQNSGNCSLIFYASPGLVTISRSEGRARLSLSGEQAARFADAFVVQEGGGMVFRSRDGRLTISADMSSSAAAVGRFVVDWNGRGLP